MYHGLIVSGERQMTREELLANAARAAGGFRALGVGDDDAVCLLMRNDFAFLEASMGAALAGAYAAPINWHGSPAEVAYILKDCDARVLVAHTDLLAAAGDVIPPGCRVLAVATPPEIATAYGLKESDCLPPSASSSSGTPVAPPPGEWREWLAVQTPHPGPPPPNRTSMIYTSGTTGHPKGVRREPANEEVQARNDELYGTVFGLRADDDIRTVITGPMYHSAPNAYGLLAARMAGLVVLQPRFDPEELLRLIEKYRITHMHMVPTMLVRMLKLPEAARADHDLSSLRHVVHAAAPCPPDVKRRMIEWLGPVVHEYYGATETGATVFHTAEEALAKPGTVGKPLRWTELKILDENGDELPTGEIGEVYMRLTGWPDFTYNKAPEKRAACAVGHLVTCGDVGYLDADGYLFLCDRKNDMVISGGVNIYPAEVEMALLGMSGVQDCAVFGIPDDEYGEALAAHVSLTDPALDEADIRRYLADRLARFKVPRLVVIDDDLPRQDSGKIFKRKLREPYWAKAGRQI